MLDELERKNNEFYSFYGWIGRATPARTDAQINRLDLSPSYRRRLVKRARIDRKILCREVYDLFTRGEL